MRDPGGVLGEIIARKRVDVAARFADVAPDALRDEALRAPAPARSLSAALRRPGARFIMEVKRASPSAGAINPHADPVRVARGYAGAADAISVLTDTPYFGGSLADLTAVRGVYDGPILAKDFMIDARQVAEARLAGADAVLVMLSVLDDGEAGEIMREAARLGMEALVETHDEAEMARAAALGAAIIGVNNRDLRTLSIDLNTTRRLAARAPKDAVLISESGISGRADVESLAPLADAFLIGSSLMRAEAPAQAARALAFGAVKVCGVTNAADAEAALGAGAALLGCILAPGGARTVTAAAARAVVAAAHGAGCAAVGVFRDADVDAVAGAVERFGFDVAQLHGREDAAFIGALRRRLPEHVQIWRVCPMAPNGEVLETPPRGADRLVFDTALGGRSGGQGVAFAWSALAGRADLTTSVLAGGLNPGNVRAAARVGAYALDVSSGVEATPGRKDGAKLAAFFEALRPSARGEIAYVK